MHLSEENNRTPGLILGIETSCDETSAAVVRRGREVLSNIVASQIATHSAYGGVVPELASREHLRNIVPVIRESLSSAAVEITDLDAVAVTEGPGLAGALLVGISYAKALAYAIQKPLVAINHLEGHIHAVLLAAQDTIFESPAIALVVSGGHTHLYFAEYADGLWTYRNVGRTLDDAAGEAFDKVAKLLGLPYPGGPWIDALSKYGDDAAVKFSFSQVKPKPYRAAPAMNPDFLFSFSGIKTAVLRYVETHDMKEGIAMRRKNLFANPAPTVADALALCDEKTLALIASFQRAVVDDLARKTFAAAEQLGARSILISGGVAANRELRVRLTSAAAMKNLPIAFPTVSLSTDNAAMIAAAAWPKLCARAIADSALSAQPSLTLG
jgi:N6-L-threonylcarbamoyladenine synthase